MPRDVKSIEKSLLQRLETYMSMEYELLPNILGYSSEHNFSHKTTKHMVLEIFNDSATPYFHIIAMDGTLNAKFALEDGKYISGEINSRSIKRVEGFFIENQKDLLLAWNMKGFNRDDNTV